MAIAVLYHVAKEKNENKFNLDAAKCVLIIIGKIKSPAFMQVLDKGCHYICSCDGYSMD